MNCTQDSYYCQFVKFENFFSDLLGAVCLLNFARRPAHEFSAFGFVATKQITRDLYTCCKTLAHVLITQFAFSRYGFFFLKGFTVAFFPQKKSFSFFSTNVNLADLVHHDVTLFCQCFFYPNLFLSPKSDQIMQ